MWSAYNWVLMVALVAADIEWKTDLVSGKKYTIQVAPNGGTKDTVTKSCKEIGGKLPEPRNKKENDFVHNLLKSTTKGSYGAIGIHGYNGLHYYNNDASLIVWDHWSMFQVGSHPCVEMDKHYGKWKKQDCFMHDGRIQFICEKVPIDQPKPGIKWKTHIPTGKKYVFQVAPDGGTKATFNEACKKIGGMLPEPKNKMENDFVHEMLLSIVRGSGGVHFLGITKKDEVFYFDTDDTQVWWQPWSSWQGASAKCVEIDRTYGTWDVQDCSSWQRHGMQFLCEKASDDDLITTTRRRQAIPTTNTKTSGFTCTAAGYFADSTNGCKFYQCAGVGGSGDLMTCAPGTKWDQSQTACVHGSCVAVPATGDWTTHPSSGKKYKVLKSQWKPPDGNQEACKNIGAVAAEPRSKDENDFLATLQPATFMLGMSDKATEGVWTWNSDDSQVVWFNWMQWAQDKNSEPNGGLQENCSVMVRDAIPAAILANTGYDQKGWLDVDCASPLGTEVIICEKVEPEEAGDVVVVEYQLTVTIELNITNDDILNTDSEAFIDFAIEVSQVMLKNYQSVNPAVVKVKVTGVRRGSAIVDHNVGVKSADDTSTTDEIIDSVVKESASLPIVINGTSYKQTLVNKGRVSYAKTSGCGQLHPPAILLSVVSGFCQLLRCLSG